MDYSKVTMVEYQSKKLKMMNDLGRKYKKCYGVKCNKCPLGSDNSGYDCSCGELEFFHPLDAIKIVMDYEIKTDWSKVKVDTPVLCWGGDKKPEHPFKRYFAKEEDGRLYAWGCGKTSWNAGGDVTQWEHMELAEVE